MKHTFEILGGVIILIFMGLVFWQMTHPTSQPNNQVEPAACSSEAKLCPDGSGVGRIGPNCEFAECPEDTPVELPPQIPNPTPLPPEPVACTMDAKQCPDGSYVGRVGPDCEFAACPKDKPSPANVIECPKGSSEVDACIEIYQPVCGQVEVQCITTPCNPVPQTFSNSCFACMEQNVNSYVEGSCEEEI